MKKFFVLIILISLIYLSKEIYRSFPDGKLHVIFCDVGQGDAILIKTQSNKKVLIDGGGNTKVLECLSNHLSIFERTVDLIVISHKQSDHLTGLLAVFQYYQVNAVVTSKKGESDNQLIKSYLRSVEKMKKTKILNITGEEKLKIEDDVEVNFLWPEKDFQSLDINDLAVVTSIRMTNFSAIFTSDIGLLPQYLLLKKIDSNYTLVKVPHHGSVKNFDDNFYNHLKPKIAVISVGKNSFGHPGKQVVEYLQKNNINTYRTDTNGTIEIVTDGLKYYINTEK